MTRTLSRRSSAPAEEETEAPARRRSIRGASRDEDAAPARKARFRGKADRDEEDEAPAARKREISKGWSGYSKVRTESSDFAKTLEVTDEEIVIKFLDAEPFATFNQHWIERKGKRSWPCLEDCPLCALGDKPKTQVMINVVDFTNPEDPTVVVWQFGTMVADILKGLAKNDKTTPLDRTDLYFSVSKTGGGKRAGRVSYNVRPIKERDLESDWDIEPLTEDEIDAFSEKGYDDSIVQIPLRSALEDIADEISEDV